MTFEAKSAILRGTIVSRAKFKKDVKKKRKHFTAWKEPFFNRLSLELALDLFPAPHCPGFLNLTDSSLLLKILRAYFVDVLFRKIDRM